MNSKTAHGLRLSEGPETIEAHDRDDTEVFRLQFEGSAFTEGSFLLPDRRRLFVRRAGEHSPVLGAVDCFAIDSDATAIARVGAINWFSPDFIPAVDEPGALPLGAGSAVLNAVATLAECRGTPSLRYRGPYPTAVLFSILAHSFDVSGDFEACFATFTDGGEEDALLARTTERPVDFVPNPFGWHFDGERVCAELHGDGLRRVFIDGRAYGVTGRSPRRLFEEADGTFRLAIAFNGHTWVERARCGSTGRIEGEITSLPDVDSVLVGSPIADSVRAALASGLVPRAPQLLQSALDVVLTRAPMRWGDAADEYCQVRDGGLVLHAMLGESLRAAEPVMLMNTLASVIEYPAQQLAQAVLSEHHRRSLL